MARGELHGWLGHIAVMVNLVRKEEALAILRRIKEYCAPRKLLYASNKRFVELEGLRCGP